MNDPKVDCHKENRQIFMNVKMIPWPLLLFGSSIMLNTNGYWKYLEYQELQYGSLVVAYSYDCMVSPKTLKLQFLAGLIS